METIIFPTISPGVAGFIIGTLFGIGITILWIIFYIYRPLSKRDFEKLDKLYDKATKESYLEASNKSNITLISCPKCGWKYYERSK